MQMATQPWGCGRPGSLLPRHHPRREVWAALRTTPFLTPCWLLLFPSPQPHQAIATTLFQALKHVPNHQPPCDVDSCLHLPRIDRSSSPLHLTGGVQYRACLRHTLPSSRSSNRDIPFNTSTTISISQQIIIIII
jgi:hypothetical protein